MRTWIREPFGSAIASGSVIVNAPPVQFALNSLPTSLAENIVSVVSVVTAVRGMTVMLAINVALSRAPRMLSWLASVTSINVLVVLLETVTG